LFIGSSSIYGEKLTTHPSRQPRFVATGNGNHNENPEESASDPITRNPVSPIQREDDPSMQREKAAE
jgi:hypothetical protein